MVRSSRSVSIPAFALYGEASVPPIEMLHIEAIQSRSQRHRWEIDAHTHHALHQILWVASGPAEVTLEAARADCRGPLAVVIPPGAVHAFRFARDTEGLVMTFNPRAVIEGDVPATGEALRVLFAAPRLLQLEPGAASTRRIETLMGDLSDEFAASDGAGSPVPMWLARAIVWRLARQGARQARSAGSAGSVGRSGQALFTRFVVLVEAHHREHWPVSRYADRLGLTPERLNRLTREETGKAALDLVHERLTREACRRLTYVAAPIARLAFELGFEDPAYFCRFFKRRTGHSPRDYRRATAEAPPG
jgi:AraC family transcriptional regulator, transcriptional activator of pobA